MAGSVEVFCGGGPFSGAAVALVMPRRDILVHFAVHPSLGGGRGESAGEHVRLVHAAGNDHALPRHEGLVGFARHILRRHQICLLEGARFRHLRLLEEIDADTFAEKNSALRDRTAELKLEIEACDRGRNETIDLAIKAFELSQNLRSKWFASDFAAKRRILEIICLNWTLDGVSLVPEMRKPFDQVAEGLQKKDSRGDWI